MVIDTFCIKPKFKQSTKVYNQNMIDSEYILNIKKIIRLYLNHPKYFLASLISLIYCLENHLLVLIFLYA